MSELGSLLVVVLSVLCCANVLFAQEEESKAKSGPTGRMITLESPIADAALAQVRRTGLELQSLAEKEDREVYLILEVTPGTSEFHNVYALADFLTDSAIEKVNTIAWVKESVTGNNAIVPIACRKIMLAPEAALGDIGRGKSVSQDRRQIVSGIIAKRRNPRVTEALAEALMNLDASLVQVTIKSDNGDRETRLVSAQEASKLLDEGMEIEDQFTIKEPGAVGMISGRDAQERQILISNVAESRRQIAETLNLPAESLRELSTPDEIKDVAYIQLHDEIDPVFHAFALHQIDRALEAGAKTIIFEIDTPGGMLDVCMDLSSKIIRLNESGIQTVAYIPNEAISGGAIIASACTDIYMRPDARIGDAIPIHMNLTGGFEHADPKILSVLLEHMRMLAEKTNRPAAILQGYCDPKLEVFEATHKTTGRKWYMSADEIHQSGGEWIQGPRIEESRPEVAVFINGSRAHDLKIAAAPVEDLDELKGRLGIPAEMSLSAVERSWVDALVFYLNNKWITAMLFFIAIVCIYIEMATMTGFFGIIAASAFGVFFWSRMLGGTATGLELGMFALGMGCLALEIFVIPGFGVFGVSGILMVIGSIVMASMTVSGLGLEYDAGRAITAFGPFAASMVGTVIFAAIISKYLPHLPVLNGMVLSPPSANGESDEPRLRTASVVPQSDLIGAVGTAVSVLRPAGKAQINGQLYDVVSDGPYIEDGSTITVYEVRGNRVVVRTESSIS